MSFFNLDDPLLEEIKEEILNLDINKKISKVAVLGGSGSFGINEASQQKADAFVTADLKYHDFFRAENQSHMYLIPSRCINGYHGRVLISG